MSDNPQQGMLDLLRAIDTGAEELTALIDAAIAASDTVYGSLPDEQRRSLASNLSSALREAIDLNAGTPLVELLQSGEIYSYGSAFADTQALFALARRTLMKMVRPHLANSADLAVDFVDALGRLFGEVREHEVERAVREAEQRAEKHTQQLQTAIHRLEQSYLTSPLATLEADNQGIITRWNPAAERIFGWPAAEAIGRNAIELLVPGLAREHVELVVGALLSGDATNSRNENVRKDGTLITCQWHNAVLHDPDGNVTGWLSQTEDITEQLRAEQALHESQRRMDGILRNLPGMAYRCRNDQNWTMEYVSAGAMALTGYSAEALTADAAGQAQITYNELIHQADRAVVWQDIQIALKNRRSFELNYRLNRNDGEERWVWERGSGVYDDKGNVVAIEGFISDITEARRSEEERRILQEQVIEAQRQALRELSTPIIPITDGVVAMPLVGSLDSMRIQQVMETLLEGISTTRAETAILDITGVPVVDTQVADALLRAARAVKLLGAKVVLTGIRPEVAQTLVGLGLDLSGITTRATLQSGIAFALAATGVKLNT